MSPDPEGNILVDEELIKHVAATARLSLTPAEINKFVPQFKELIKYFSKLKEIDTSDTQPTLHAIPLANHFREDVVSCSLSQEQALSLTPHKKDGYFKGPKITGV